MAWQRTLTALFFASASLSLQAADGAPQFNTRGELLRPAAYRQWTFVTSGLGMTYGAARPEADQAPHFSNVFVNSEAYAAFADTGRWPDGTIFVLEIRHSERAASIDTTGRTQGARVALEAAVKDRARFPRTGWAYFDFEDREAAPALETTATCYSCHSEHGAVEWTFAQFYPELLEIARRLGTVREDYDPARVLR